MQVRGIWITNTDSQVLHSRQKIAEAMKFLADVGFNVVFPVVWARGYTLFPSQVMQKTFGIEIDPFFKGRDPLADVIVEAQKVGLWVIPWFEYGFACSYQQNGGHLLAKKPAWAARDSGGKLLTKNGFEWMNALDIQVQEFLMSLILEVVKNYDIHGIQGDDRLPSMPCEGGYDAQTVARYYQQFRQKPPENCRDLQWLQWRSDQLSEFLNRLYRSAKTLNPNCLISMAPNMYSWGLQEYLQDSKSWVDRGLIDLVHPQLYCRDFELYKTLVDRVVNEQFSKEQLPHLSPGILMNMGSYRISPEHLLAAIAYNRSRGIQGESFFFYEGLRKDYDALAKILKHQPYAQPASLPSPQDMKWRIFAQRRLGGEYHFIDKQGKKFSQLNYDWVYSLSQTRSRIQQGYKWGFIDNRGHLISTVAFDWADSFFNERARVLINGRWGYINQTGQLIISPQFDEAQSFSEGFAAVKIRNKWRYIDQKGQLLIADGFDEAQSFSEGLAAVKIQEKWGYIDKQGNLIIPAQFDHARAFSEGLAQVNIGGRSLYDRAKNQWEFSGGKWGFIRNPLL